MHGTDGAGHFVKMSNGIEYGDMQLIAEAYHLMAQGLGMAPAEMAEVFKKWNQGALDSYLVEITADVLAKTDDETGKPMIDVILDAAGQKGTGKWTSQAGLDLGVGIPQIPKPFRALPVRHQYERVAASRCSPDPPRSSWRQGAHIPNRAGRLRRQNLLLRQGYSPARGLRRIQVEPELRQRRPALARDASSAPASSASQGSFDAEPALANLLLAP
jgi:6-phosphogluconate dehydrogenase